MTDLVSDLWNAVLANPEDDSPRLIYADYLEEHGEDRLAAFIRHQITVARIVAEQDYDSDEYAEAIKFLSTFGAEDVVRLFQTAELPAISTADIQLNFERSYLTVIQRTPTHPRYWSFRRGFLTRFGMAEEYLRFVPETDIEIDRPIPDSVLKLFDAICRQPLKSIRSYQGVIRIRFFPENEWEIEFPQSVKTVFNHREAMSFVREYLNHFWLTYNYDFHPL